MVDQYLKSLTLEIEPLDNAFFLTLHCKRKKNFLSKAEIFYEIKEKVFYEYQDYNREIESIIYTSETQLLSPALSTESDIKMLQVEDWKAFFDNPTQDLAVKKHPDVEHEWELIIKLTIFFHPITFRKIVEL